MDPKVIDIFYYHSLLHPDPPENTIIPTTSTVLDDSSVLTPSTLTLDEFPDNFFRTVDNYYFGTSFKSHYTNHRQFYRSPVKYVFDLRVLLQPDLSGTSLNSNCSVTTVSSIRTSDVYNTVDHPIPVTYKQREAYKKARLLTPFGFIKRPTSTSNIKERWYSTVRCRHNHYQVFHDFKENPGTSGNPMARRFMYAESALQISLSKDCYNKRIVDKPTRRYLAKLQDPTYLKQEHYKEGHNCYSVTPVEGNHILTVHQHLGHICFSDVTTYYSSYSHTRKKGSVKVPAIRSKKVKVINRYQSYHFYYYSRIGNRLDNNDPVYGWSHLKRNVRLFRDGHFIVINTGWFATSTSKRSLRGDPALQYIFKSDKRYIKYYKYLAHKIPIVEDPDHPLCVAHDYPAITRIFKKRESDFERTTTVGEFTLSNDRWTVRHPFQFILDERITRRKWLYRELLNNWIRLKVEV